jgi:pyruvate kinase
MTGASTRHTKIVATVGPSCDGPETLADLVRAGVDVFRLNFSHGNHASHTAAFRAIRDASRSQNRPIAIMQDLSGPKIRTGPLVAATPIPLEAGDRFAIAAGDRPGTRDRIFTAFAQLIRSAKPGNRLLLDDGRIELRVIAASGDELTVEVVNGGSLGEHKGINAPGVTFPASAITEKDAADLRVGLELGVDFVALSFVQTAEDILRARALMEGAASRPQLIAKIERPAAVENLDAILAAADGVMVARGDLGLEMPLERVPRVQKRIIRAARAVGRPSIVATQVLESMRNDPRPTRAEVSDAANAVDEGTDAIMLAGETAAGAHPVEAVETLAAIIADAELMPATESVSLADDSVVSRHGRALGEAAITLARTSHAAAIIAVTREGKTARLLSALRPTATIYAATPGDRVAAQLSLLRGVVPIVTSERDPERLERVLLDRAILEAGTVAVFINVSRELDRIDANFLNVQRLG